MGAEISRSWSHVEAGSSQFRSRFPRCHSASCLFLDANRQQETEHLFVPEVLGPGLFPRGLLSARQCLPTVGLTPPIAVETQVHLWGGGGGVGGGSMGVASACRVGWVTSLCEPLVPGSHQTSEGVGGQHRRASAISRVTSCWEGDAAECAWDVTPRVSFF